MSNETFKNTNEAICGLYKVYCELCGHFLEHQKREFYTTDPFVEYILYLPAVFIKLETQMVNHWLQSTNHGVLENGPKFHKNGQMAFINTYFPYFMGFLFLLSFKITQKVSFESFHECLLHWNKSRWIHSLNAEISIK